MKDNLLNSPTVRKITIMSNQKTINTSFAEWISIFIIRISVNNQTELTDETQNPNLIRNLHNEQMDGGKKTNLLFKWRWKLENWMNIIFGRRGRNPLFVNSLFILIFDIQTFYWELGSITTNEHFNTHCCWKLENLFIHSYENHLTSSIQRSLSQQIQLFPQYFFVATSTNAWGLIFRCFESAKRMKDLTNRSSQSSKEMLERRSSWRICSNR